MRNKYDVLDAETGLQQIKDEQTQFAGDKQILSTDVSAFTKGTTIDKAQMSYDQLVGTTELDYDQTMSTYGGQLEDLTMQGTSTYGDLQNQIRATGSGGMAVQGYIKTIAQEQKDRLLNRFMSDTTKIQKSMDYTTKRKDMTLSHAGDALDFTKDVAGRQHELNLRGTDLTHDMTLAGIEEQYQSGLTQLAGTPGAGTRTEFGSFVEGFFS